MPSDVTVHDSNESSTSSESSKPSATSYGGGVELPSVVEAVGEEARQKFLEFFLAQISSENTRKAYARATRQFFRWCEERSLKLEEIGPNVAALYVRAHDGADATVKQHLAALRKLYDWLHVERVVQENPFSSVRGPKLVRSEGETPALSSEEVQQLFARIDEEDTVVALRDGALIGAMLYTFGRVGAVVAMRVKDYAPASAGKKVLCLREKGGKRHRVPAHHKLRERMDAYLSAAGIEGEDETPLFQAANRLKELTGRQLNRRRAWNMVKRRARQAGIEKDIFAETLLGWGVKRTGLTTVFAEGSVQVPSIPHCGEATSNDKTQEAPYAHFSKDLSPPPEPAPSVSTGAKKETSKAGSTGAPRRGGRVVGKDEDVVSE
jgi:site-specific recombinase XerD